MGGCFSWQCCCYSALHACPEGACSWLGGGNNACPTHFVTRRRGAGRLPPQAGRLVGRRLGTCVCRMASAADSSRCWLGACTQTLLPAACRAAFPPCCTCGAFVVPLSKWGCQPQGCHQWCSAPAAGVAQGAAAGAALVATVLAGPIHLAVGRVAQVARLAVNGQAPAGSRAGKKRNVSEARACW